MIEIFFGDLLLGSNWEIYIKLDVLIYNDEFIVWGMYLFEMIFILKRVKYICSYSYMFIM